MPRNQTTPPLEDIGDDAVRERAIDGMVASLRELSRLMGQGGAAEKSAAVP